MTAPPSPNTRLVDNRGRPVALGLRLARGGEGSVYAVPDRTDLVAKVYHGTVSTEKAEKLAAMARLSSERLRRLAAWPIDTLHERESGTTRGILMPFVRDHSELHVLYGPKTRLQVFPDASFPFLVHAAANVARAFAVIHEHGHVIGDVNHGSVLVSKQGIVTLVDCDSFQINDGHRRYLCTVGVPTHTPPELQGKSFADVVRTPNHDVFGLAVLIFQLLLLGRHPYSGIFQGMGEPSLESAIREHRFAYGRDAAIRQMRQPPDTPSLAVATPTVATLFEQAFSAAGALPQTRPTARDWVDALSAAMRQLVVCSRYNGHHYPRALSDCPWCPIESTTGLLLFNLALPRVGLDQPNATFNLQAVWAQIVAVPDPGPSPPIVRAPTLPQAPTSVSTFQQRASMAIKGLTVGAVATGLSGSTIIAVAEFANPLRLLALALATFAGAIHIWRQQDPKRVAAVQAVQSARAHLSTVERRWQTDSGNVKFLAQRRELEIVRDAYQALSVERQRRIEKLRANLRQRQLEQYLDRFRIAAASLSNIGPGRTASLESFGIFTAADVTERAILGVPGFGPVLAGNLVSWRRGIEARFVFNPQRGVDPADLAVVERDIATRRVNLERQLREGPTKLQRIVQQVIAARAAIEPIVQQAHTALAQADANLRTL